MADVEITKPSAAQRQIDAAIRMLFSGEDQLAVHTITAAALGIVTDLADERGLRSLDSAMAAALTALSQELLHSTPSDDDIHKNLRNFRRRYRWIRNRPANFLKHANNDAERTLGQLSLSTDYLILEACVLYRELGFQLTHEMEAFGRWHLAIYPHEIGDEIRTAAGQLHDLRRDEQLEFGDYLLDLFRKRVGERVDLAPC